MVLCGLCFSEIVPVCQYYAGNPEALRDEQEKNINSNLVIHPPKES
jgi:hypothetical protein